MNKIYSCPESIIWSYQERSNDQLRKCTSCDKICYQIFARTFYGNPKKIDNFCSKKCWDKKHILKDGEFIAIKKEV